MRFTLPLALVTATAFSVNTLPVRAMPAAGVNLFRIDAEGVQALPDIQKISAALESQNPKPTDPLQSSEVQAEPLISQASPNRSTSAPASNDDVTLLPTGKEDWKICFDGPLPLFDPWEYLSIRNPANDEEVERILLTSDRITYSENRRCMTIDPEIEIEPGEKFSALLPDGPNPLPQRVDPCSFAVAPAAAAAPAGGGAWWLLIPVAGLAICAIAGCFSSGGGGGGAPVSR